MTTTIDDDPVSRVLAELTAGNLGPGERLPTERELAARTGVGRAAVRRALAGLEADGRITRHVGRGTFLTDGHRAAPAPAGPRPDQASPAEVMEVRLLLEPQVVRLVTAEATPQDLARIEHCFDRCETASEFEEFEHWDAALHRAITDATHNRFLMELVGMVDAARRDPLWGQLKRRGFDEERRQRYQHQHRDIVTALVERDPEAAVTAMRTHLLDVRRNLLDH